jgi:hypothetical protein
MAHDDRMTMGTLIGDPETFIEASYGVSESMREATACHDQT